MRVEISDLLSPSRLSAIIKGSHHPHPSVIEGPHHRTLMKGGEPSPARIVASSSSNHLGPPFSGTRLTSSRANFAGHPSPSLKSHRSVFRRPRTPCQIQRLHHWHSDRRSSTTEDAVVEEPWPRAHQRH